MALDVRPSPAQYRLFHLLFEGAELALYPDGAYRVRQTEDLVQRQTLASCIRRQWITSWPGYPLFDRGACRLTPLGVKALGRPVETKPDPAHAARARLAWTSASRAASRNPSV